MRVAVLPLVLVLARASSVQAQLPHCTVDLNNCMDGHTECGATFNGGDGCITIGVQACYTTGSFSYRISQGDSLTITFSDDVLRLTCLFAHQGAAAAGTMSSFDVADQPVDAPVNTTGDCTSVHAPDTLLEFSTAIRKIQIDNTGTGAIWIDTLEINPPCIDGGCDDGDPCTVDDCRPDGCRNEPMDCDDGDPCTDDSCNAGVCEHDAIDNCNGNANGNTNNNGNANNNGNTNGNNNLNDNMNGGGNTNTNDNTGGDPSNTNDNGGPGPNPVGMDCGECQPGAMTLAMSAMVLAFFVRRRR